MVPKNWIDIFLQAFFWTHLKKVHIIIEGMSKFIHHISQKTIWNAADWNALIYQKWIARITCHEVWIFEMYFNFYFLALIWAAIRSKSRRPWEESLRPPLGSFSTSFNCSKVCKAFLAMVPDPADQWLGFEPLFLRTEKENCRKC